MRSTRVLLPAIALLLLGVAGLSTRAHASGAVSTRHVLIINSYHYGFTWSDQIVEGLEHELPPNLEISVEYLDSKRHLEDSHAEVFAELLQSKYEQHPPQLLITTDDAALRFIASRAESLFPGVPVVFCGVNEPIPEQRLNRSQFTGAIEVNDPADAIDAILDFLPNTELIYVICDNTLNGIGDRQRLERHRLSGRVSVPIVFLDSSDGLDPLQVIDRLRQAAPDSVVLFRSYYRGPAGEYIPYEDWLPRFARSAPVAIFGTAMMHLDHGIAGGYLASAFDHGVDTARIAERVLNGTSPADIPISTRQNSRLFYDHQVLSRLGYDVSAIPDAATVVNQPPRNQNNPRRFLFASLLLISGLTLAVIVLGINTLRRVRAERSLKEREQQLGSIFRSSHDAILTWADNSERTILQANPATLRLLGLTADNTIGRSSREILDERIFDSFDTIVSHSIRTHGVWRGDWTFRSADPSKPMRNLEVTVTQIQGSREYLAIMRDVTERIESEEKLRAAKDAAEAADRAKSEFLAMMSHEIRTPMNAVIGFAALLLDTELDSVQREYLTHIIRGSEALVSIINDILDFSHLEPHRVRLNLEPTDVRDVVVESVDLIRYRMSERGSEVSVSFDAALPASLRIDRQRFRQILTKLLQNAYKFTVKGDIEVRVGGEWLQTGTQWHLVLEVIDSGIGIPQDRIEEIFKPFSKLREQSISSPGGTGLGLAIVQRLVTLMSGTVTCQSVLGEGSTFRVQIPCGTTDEESASQLVASGSKFASHYKFPLRIACAEDDLENQNVLRIILDRFGTDTTFCVNGVDLIDTLSRESFDLVLMDVRMPKMDGAKATRQIRAGAAGNRNRNIYIIGQTAFALTGDREQCLEAGMDDYLSKPIRVDDLRSALVRFMSTRHPEDASASHREA